MGLLFSVGGLRVFSGGMVYFFRFLFVWFLEFNFIFFLFLLIRGRRKFLCVCVFLNFIY